MTDRISGKDKSPSALHEPDYIEAVDGSAVTPADDGSLSGRTARETDLPRRPFLKIDRFSLRQSGFTVPKPSYFRHGGINAMTAQDVTSSDKLPPPDSDHALEEDATEANSNEASTNQGPRRSKTILRWVYVLLSLIFFIVYRMHVLSH